MGGGLLKVRDAVPTLGMNTVDHPKTLRSGECQMLKNMRPGEPPVPRCGLVGNYLDGSESWTVINPACHHVAASRKIVWVYDSSVDKYKVLSIPDDSDGTDYAVILTVTMNSYFYPPWKFPKVDMVYAHSCVYIVHPGFGKNRLFSIVDASGRYFTGNAQVVESDGLTVREMCISDAPSVGPATCVAGSGGFKKDECYGYTAVYIRRTDVLAWEVGAADAHMVLPAGMAGVRPKNVETAAVPVVEGIVDAGASCQVKIGADGDLVHVAVNLTVPAGVYGFTPTHLRIYRSAKQATTDDAAGATKLFLYDLKLGVPEYNDSFYVDITSDEELEGEFTQLTADQYTTAPDAEFIEFCKGRMWLMTGGMAYYSEITNGDGGALPEDANEAPQKWASMFKPGLYFLDLARDDGEEARGMRVCGDDLVMCKESKIFSLYGGDPLVAVATQITNAMGCAFPFTLTKVTAPGTFNKELWFISTSGPARMASGGQIELFEPFKIKELWPQLDMELFNEITAHPDWIRAMCSAAFQKSEWVVCWQLYNGPSKVFGYYIEPWGNKDSGPRGSYQVEFAPQT